MSLQRTSSFRSLITFKVLYENNNATKAAEALGITQSGVSRSLALLEKQLQFPLFIREKNRLLATPEADGLYADLSLMTDALLELEQNINSIRDYGTSRIRIAATPGLGFNYAPRVISDTFADFESSSITFAIQSSDEVARELETGLIDIGFLALPVHSDILIFEEINTSEAVCILPSTHPLAKKSSINVKDFTGQHLVIVSQPHDPTHQVNELLKESGVKVGKKTECNISSMGSFVSHNMGIGIINYTTVQDLLTHQPNIVVRPFLPTLEYKFALAYRPKWQHTKTLKLIRHSIEKVNHSYLSKYSV